MISINQFDSDPYTGINILEDDVVARREHVIFDYAEFVALLERDNFVANDVAEMSKKIEEYQEVKRAESTEEILRALRS